MSIFLLIVAGILPVLACLGFYFAEKKTPFGQLRYWGKQAIFGVVFGAIAVLATEVFSTDIGGALINVRDAAPLTAGLVLGGPAGVIAGLIGGAERALLRPLGRRYIHGGRLLRFDCACGRVRLSVP